MNLFKLPKSLPEDELCETLVDDGPVLIERIISTGQSTEAGTWLDQKRGEWVVLLQGKAELAFEDGRKVVMGAGDYILIQSHQRHRVEYTSTNPPCIWLAVHAPLTGNHVC